MITASQVKNCLGILLFFFLFLLYYNGSSGTWGGDSDGYYMGAHFILTQDSITNFNTSYDEQLLPNRYSLNSQEELQFRYPPGISTFIAEFTTLFNEKLGVNFFITLFATLNVVLVFILLIKLIPENTISYLFAFVGVLGFATNKLYLQYGMAQPMREIAVIFFVLLSVLFFLQFKKNQKEIYFLTSLLTAICALYFRYSAIVIFLMYLPHFYQKLKESKSIFKVLYDYKISIILGFILLLPILFYVQAQFFQNQSDHSFQQHLSSFSLENTYDNKGKYQTSIGAVPIYFDYFNNKGLLFFLFFGCIYLFKIRRLEIILFPILTFFLFSMWPNPYPRYILPVIPFYYVLFSLGIVFLISTKKINFSLKCFFSFVFLLLVLPTIFIQVELNFLENKNYHKSLNSFEYKQLKQLSLDNSSLFIDEHLREQYGFISFLHPQIPIYNINSLNQSNTGKKYYLTQNSSYDSNIEEIIYIKFSTYYLYNLS